MTHWPTLSSGLLGLGLLMACGASGSSAPPGVPAASEFSATQRVTILGYSGDAMEPFLSADGQTLFFNNSNDPAVDTNLHYASRADGLTFQYQGEVTGANSTVLDGVPSLDGAGTFYFISVRSYATNRATVYRGHWTGSVLTGLEQVAGIPASAPGKVIFDAGISADGQTLCFAEGEYGSGTLSTAHLELAARTPTGFLRDPASATLLQQVNLAGATLYAPAFSASGLDLYFSRLEGLGTPAPITTIMVASRPSLGAPFGPAKAIPAITGFVEAPTVSADGKALYYHALVSRQFVVYRVTRP